MKTTTLTLSALALLAGLAACTKENFNPSSSSDTHNDGNGLKVTLVAGQENEAGTRAEIGQTTGDDKKTTTILWSEGDDLSVFDGDNSNIEFSIKSGTGTASGTFEGEVSKTSDKYVALHPYQSAATISSDRNSISGVTLSSEQTAVAGSFDPEAALMTAVEATKGTLAFKNIVGYIKVTPTSDCKKITLTSNSTSVNLAGTVDISIADDGTPTANIASSASDASNSVSISGDIKAGSTYYIAALPATLEGGFKLIFTDSEGKETSKTSSNTLTIKRNTITDLGIVSGTTPYLTFSAASAQKFKMNLYGSGVNASDFKYSVGNGAWTTLAFNTTVEFGGTKGDLRLRGTSSVGTAAGNYNYSTISFTDSNVEVECTGDIRTLVDWEDYANADTKNARFQGLFLGCSVLTSAPELPATKLADYCYDSMFTGCTKLGTAPKLPATTLAQSCYYSMFYGCTALKSEIELPATALVMECYLSMFYGCSSLTNVTIKATETATDALKNWLTDTVPSGDKNPRTIYCANPDIIGTPEGWTVVQLPTDSQ